MRTGLLHTHSSGGFYLILRTHLNSTLSSADGLLRTVAPQMAALVPRAWIKKRNDSIVAHGGASRTGFGFSPTGFQQDAPALSIQLEIILSVTPNLPVVT